jgi:predicted deacylase
MIAQPFEGRSPDASGALRRAETITPDDGQHLNFETRAIYVSDGGDLAFVSANGETVTLGGLLGGVIYPIAAHRVLANGTTASGLVALS